MNEFRKENMKSESQQQQAYFSKKTGVMVGMKINIRSGT